MNFEIAHNSLHLTQFSLTRIQFHQSRNTTTNKETQNPNHSRSSLKQQRPEPQIAKKTQLGFR
jgi:hypothetical protein